MKCPRCGYNNRAGNNYCEKCGRLLPNGTDYNTLVQNSKKWENFEEWRDIIIGLVCMIVILGAVGCGLYWGGKKIWYYFAQEDKGTLEVFAQNGLEGLHWSKNGEVAVPCEYDSIKMRGHWLLYKGDRMGLALKRNGLVVAPCVYDTVYMSFRMAVLRDTAKHEDMLRLSDGKIVTEGKHYDYINWFGLDNVAVVAYQKTNPYLESAQQMEWAYALIDSTGTHITGFDYRWLGSFSEGLCVAQMRAMGNLGFINTMGQQVIEPRYWSWKGQNGMYAPTGEIRFVNDTACVSLNGANGYLNSDGTFTTLR